MGANPVFDELYIVSDLHLGGETPQRQIFKQGDVFADFVDKILAAPKKKSIKQALVINGDLVDFLAEPDPKYFDLVHAANKLDRIFHDPSFVPVWNALRQFVASPNRTLIITLGNHDLELALPRIRHQLIQELTGGQASLSGRIWLAFEKGGFECQVGKANVLCVHGNDVDPWNATDFETLNRMGNDASFSAAASNWIPNGGTKLVIDVMNEIKAEYPFVDLLKPEEGGVVPTLLVLKPSLAPKIGDAVPAWLRSRYDQLRIATGFLSDELVNAELMRVDVPRSSTKVLDKMLGDTFGSGMPVVQGDNSIDELLGRAEERLRKGITPMQLSARTGEPEYLGTIGAIWNLVTFKGRSEVLREALEKLQHDRSFQILTADDTYRALDQKVSEATDFVAAGHTHLRRAIPRTKGRGFYYNSGTWVRLIQIETEMLSSSAKFQPIFESLQHGSMAVLDSNPNLVKLIPTAVYIGSSDKGVSGELKVMASGRLESVDRSGHMRT